MCAKVLVEWYVSGRRRAEGASILAGAGRRQTDGPGADFFLGLDRPSCSDSRVVMANACLRYLVRFTR